ncbi:MAG: AbrB/MazE/SpoVT family DNA-binding domain-containing protein [Burkholderiales bacterium]|nr:AbrB/MazE/SpoVT family DNA-binding domain-containing protein [Burkholderiales bacterium]
MNLSRLSSKGQLVIPKAVRAWPPGTEFSVIRTEAGLQLTPVATISATTVDAGFGVLAGIARAPQKPTGDDDAALLAALRKDDEASKR